MIRITVAWPTPEGVTTAILELAEGASVGQARALLDTLTPLPELALRQAPPVVYGRLRRDEDKLHDGDRLELTEPLRVDPKVARERRVAHRRAALSRSRWRPQG